MAQPWRPSRGTGASRWGSTPGQRGHHQQQDGSRTAPSSSSPSAHPSARYDGQKRDDSISASGMRAANLRPVRDNPMDLSSPSRGEVIPGKSLTSRAVQDEFRQHLEVKVKQYQATYPDELGIIIANSAKQKEQLDLILLEFRKLREGVISSSREDAFAVEVYETSAKLAILSRNVPQISTILPHLVRRLHRLPGTAYGEYGLPGQESVEALGQQFEGASITLKPGSSLDTRARFVSYYLLHTLLALGSPSGFQDQMKDLVDFDANPSAHSDARIPASHIHIRFALDIFRIVNTNNYAALATVILNPYKHDKFAWILVRSALPALQDKAWQVLKASYLSTTDRRWLAKNLCCSDEAGLTGWLARKQLEEHLNSDGSVRLKQGQVKT